MAENGYRCFNCRVVSRLLGFKSNVSITLLVFSAEPSCLPVWLHGGVVVWWSGNGSDGGGGGDGPVHKGALQLAAHGREALIHQLRLRIVSPCALTCTDRSPSFHRGSLRAVELMPQRLARIAFWSTDEQCCCCAQQLSAY